MCGLVKNFLAEAKGQGSLIPRITTINPPKSYKAPYLQQAAEAKLAGAKES